ncbi:hypothetical protein AVEN_56630-1 [Araneus ventricosus]|uniref:Uncharacterized protein n=1 Tax=Araneus ventricosus TaxID=182803 RepID=A0A4Y2WKI8_ARAVE|nr:hypothetical protein AVEN_56630-1 [Araneus ventricosus]
MKSLDAEVKHTPDYSLPRDDNGELTSSDRAKTSEQAAGESEPEAQRRPERQHHEAEVLPVARFRHRDLRLRHPPGGEDPDFQALRKGVNGFSVETAVFGKHPFSPSSDSLTDAWAPTTHKLCHNQAFCGLCDAHSSFAYRPFKTNFTRGDPTILPYELIHSRNRGTVGHNVLLPRARQVLDVYAFRLITLTPPEYGDLFHPAINL